MTNKSKQCKTCLQIKPLYKFYRNATSADGHRNDCAVCCAAGAATALTKGVSHAQREKAAEAFAERERAAMALWDKVSRRREKKWRRAINAD